MEHIKSKLRPQLEKELQGVDRRDPEAVLAAHRRFRHSVEAVIAKNPSLGAGGRDVQLRQATEEVIAEHQAVLPRATRPEQPGRAWRLTRLGGFSRGLLTGLLLSVVVMSGIVIAALSGGMLNLAAGDETQDLQRLRHGYEEAQPITQALQRYLLEVREEVLARQQQEPASLESAVGSRLTHVRELDAALWERRPEGLPRGVTVIVQADRSRYKVLAAGPLCWSAHAMDPELVDPQRRNNGSDCTHFGYWNEAGAEF